MEQKLRLIAERVCKLQEHDVAVELLRLDSILEETSTDPKLNLRVKQRMVELELTRLIVVSLKLNFDFVTGTWKTAEKLANILVSSLSGLRLSIDGIGDVSSEFVGNSAVAILQLARRIQLKDKEAAAVSRKSNSPDAVLQHVILLVSVFPGCAAEVFNSVWFPQILIDSADFESSTTVLRLTAQLLECLSPDGSVVNQSGMHMVLDELVYRLSTSADSDIGRLSVECMLSLCGQSRSVADLVRTRYRGLRPLLSRWSSRGFQQQLDRLRSMLKQNSEQDGKWRAALRIQSYFRGYRARKFFRGLKSEQANFPSHPASDSANQLRLLQIHAQRRRTELELQRRRAVRRLLQTQLRAIEALPVREVQWYLDYQRNRAATVIQAWYRGLQCRRRFLARDVHAGRTGDVPLPPPTQAQPPPTISLEISAERREALARLIEERRLATADRPAPSPDQQRALYERAQFALAAYWSRFAASRRRQLECEASLAMLQSDSELLLGERPTLAGAHDATGARFRTALTDVRALAARRHQAMMAAALSQGLAAQSTDLRGLDDEAAMWSDVSLYGDVLDEEEMRAYDRNLLGFDI